MDESTLITPKTRRDMRTLAFYLVYAVDRSDYTTSLEQIIELFHEKYNVEVPEDSLAFHMAQGAIETREERDKEISSFLHNWKLERLGCCTHLILRLALWELHQPDAVPNIIINEAIELAKCFAEKDAYKFINGILDEASKKIVSQGEHLSNENPAKKD